MTKLFAFISLFFILFAGVINQKQEVRTEKRIVEAVYSVDSCSVSYDSVCVDDMSIDEFADFEQYMLENGVILSYAR